MIKKPHSKTRETNTDPYASLNRKAWINDVVIDKYGELIMQQYPDVYLFSSLFSQGFLRMKRPYSYNNKFNKTHDMFKKRLFFFPLLHSSHWFTCYIDCEKHELIVLDPHIEDMSAEDLQNLEKKYKAIMKKLEDEYIRVNFKELGKTGWDELKKKVLFPPSIPEQKDGHNC